MKAKPWENSKQFTYLYGHDAIEYALQNDLQVTVIPNDLMDQGGVLRICDSSEHLEKAKEIADANGSIAVIRYATMAANWFHKFYERKDIPDSQPEMISFGKDKLNNVDEINVSFFHDSREKHERYQFPDGSAIIIRNDFSWGQGVHIDNCHADRDLQCIPHWSDSLQLPRTLQK